MVLARKESFLSCSSVRYFVRLIELIHYPVIKFPLEGANVVFPEPLSPRIPQYSDDDNVKLSTLTTECSSHLE